MSRRGLVVATAGSARRRAVRKRFAAAWILVGCAHPPAPPARAPATSAVEHPAAPAPPVAPVDLPVPNVELIGPLPEVPPPGRKNDPFEPARDPEPAMGSAAWCQMPGHRCNPPPHRAAKPVTARVINVQKDGDLLVIVLNVGRNEGVERGWTGEIVGVEGSGFTINTVRRSQSSGSVRLSRDAIPADAEAILREP